MPRVGKTSEQYFGSWTGHCSYKPRCRINLHLLKRGFLWSFQGSHVTLYYTLQFSYKSLKAGCFGIFRVCCALLSSLSRVCWIWRCFVVVEISNLFKCLGFLCPVWVLLESWIDLRGNHSRGDMCQEWSSHSLPWFCPAFVWQSWTVHMFVLSLWPVEQLTSSVV